MSGPPADLPPAWADNPRRVAVRAELVGDGGPVPLALKGGTVAHDWGDVWRSAASLTLPWDPDVWGLVREWAQPSVNVYADCVLPSGKLVPVRVFSGRVRSAGVRRPDDLIDVAAAGPAALVDDQPFSAPWTSPPGPSAAAVCRALIESALGSVVWTTVDDGAAVAAAADTGESRLRAVEQIADAAALDVYADVDGRWVCRRQITAPAGTAADTLQVGPNGAIMESGSEYDRGPFANGYTVRAEWVESGGVARSAVGTATHDDPASLTRWGGPAGKRMRADRETGPLDAAACRAIAAARLSRALAAGRGARLTVPIRPWLYPGDTLGVVLPYGAPRYQIAQRVAHDLAALTTTIDTRQNGADPT